MAVDAAQEPTGAFVQVAAQYLKAGYSPIPIAFGAKRPPINGWQQYCTTQPTVDDLAKWSKKYPNAGIGLALGKHIGEYVLLALDVDDDEFLPTVLDIVGETRPAKVGRKGRTMFFRAPVGTKSIKLKRKKTVQPITGVTEIQKPAVEFLAHGNQTVIPPTIHPDTNEPYTWIDGVSLLDVEELPLLTAAMISEIRTALDGSRPSLDELRSMVWAGVGGGGNTHNSELAAVGAMVGLGWPDEDIHARIKRAHKAAMERAGEDYSWPTADKEITAWILSAKEKGFQSDELNADGTATKMSMERRIANWARAQLGGPKNIAMVNGVLRQYADGHWHVVELKNIIADAMEEFETIGGSVARKGVESVCDSLRANPDFGRTPGVSSRYDEMRHRVCLRNVTMNLVTGKVEKHSADHQLIHQLSFDYKPDATCPTYERVLIETFDNDTRSIETWDEFCALTLIDDLSFQRTLFLVGNGGNGKSTLGSLLQSMHDPDSVGAISITSLDNERCKYALLGKRVNISSEQSRLNVLSDTVFKRITGGDPVDIRMLYQEVQTVVLPTRFLQMVNEMPATADTSEALKRRMMILQCPNRVQRPDVDLAAKLYGERSGILLRWSAALQRLMERGCFDEPESSRLLVEEYALDNDPVAYWIQERVDVIAEDQPLSDWTPYNELYGDFLDFVDSYKLLRYGLNERIFARKLTQMGHPMRKVWLRGKAQSARALKLRRQDSTRGVEI